MIQTLTVETIDLKDPKTFTYKQGKRKGQQGQLFPVSIKSDGKWYNGTMFSEQDAEVFRNVKKGDKVTVEIFQEDFNGKTYDKFKLPSKEESLKAEIELMKKIINNLIKLNNLKYK